MKWGKNVLREYTIIKKIIMSDLCEYYKVLRWMFQNTQSIDTRFVCASVHIDKRERERE